MARLKLIRSEEKTNSLANMILILNGQSLAIIGNGEIKEFDVPAGRHKLKAKIDSYGSKNFLFSIVEKETKVFTLSNNKANEFGAFMSGSVIADFIVNAFLLFYYFTTGHNNYIIVKELKDTWQDSETNKNF